MLRILGFYNTKYKGNDKVCVYFTKQNTKEMLGFQDFTKQNTKEIVSFFEDFTKQNTKEILRVLEDFTK